MTFITISVILYFMLETLQNNTNRRPKQKLLNRSQKFAAGAILGVSAATGAGLLAGVETLVGSNHSASVELARQAAPLSALTAAIEAVKNGKSIPALSQSITQPGRSESSVINVTPIVVEAENGSTYFAYFSGMEPNISTMSSAEAASLMKLVPLENPAGINQDVLPAHLNDNGQLVVNKGNHLIEVGQETEIQKSTPNA